MATICSIYWQVLHNIQGFTYVSKSRDNPMRYLLPSEKGKNSLSAPTSVVDYKTQFSPPPYIHSLGSVTFKLLSLGS